MRSGVILGPKADALAQKQYVQTIGKVRKYTLSMERWNSISETIELPGGITFPIEQIWEEDLVPPGTYMNGVFLSLQVLMVCVGGRVQVNIHDGSEKHRISLMPGHMLWVPPLVWHQFFCKAPSRILLYVDKQMPLARYFKMTDQEFVAFRKGIPL